MQRAPPEADGHVAPAATACIGALGVITFALLLGIPYAANLGTLPLDGAAGETAEGHTRMVVAAVAGGLATLGVTIALVATAMTWMRHARRQFLWGLWSLASVVLELGLCCYPLWLNGVMTAPERMIFNELDPKRVAPFVWFRDWFKEPQWPVTFGTQLIVVFTPFITWRVITGLRQKRWSWNLAAEAALPLAWLCLHRPMVQAWGWSLD